MQDTYNKAGYWTFLIVLALNVLFFIFVSLVHEGVKPIDTIGKQSIKIEAPAKDSQ